MKWNKFPETRPAEYESVLVWFDGVWRGVGFWYFGRIHTPEESFEKCWWQEIVPPKEEKEETE